MSISRGFLARTVVSVIIMPIKFKSDEINCVVKIGQLKMERKNLREALEASTSDELITLRSLVFFL